MTSALSLSQSVNNFKTAKKCDMCDKKDKFQGFKLLTCKECGVSAHEECYGVERRSDEKDSDFVCHGCAAVGSDILCHSGKHLKQANRPTECALCSVNDGVHIMHPLYDKQGGDAKQVSLPAEGDLPERPAWVHSLCAFNLCMINGSVYGVNRRGGYEEVLSESESDDELVMGPGTLNSVRAKKRREAARSTDKTGKENDARDSDSDTSEQDNSVHHFVISCEEDGWEYGELIRKSRAMRCIFCGKKDKKSTRLPVTCTAGLKREFHEFATRHPDLSEGCTVPMHVGCARWGFGGAKPPHKRVFFFPGTSEDEKFDKNLMAECYCEAHAHDIFANKPGRAEAVQEKKMQAKRKMLKIEEERRLKAARAFLMAERNGSRVAPVVPVGRRFSTGTQPRIGNVAVAATAASHRRNSDPVVGNKAAHRGASSAAQSVELKRAKLNAKSSQQGQGGRGEKREHSSKSLADGPVHAKRQKTVATGLTSDREEEENPWSRLWYPSFDGKKYEFGEWDTYVVDSTVTKPIDHGSKIKS